MAWEETFTSFYLLNRVGLGNQNETITILYKKNYNRYLGGSVMCDDFNQGFYQQSETDLIKRLQNIAEQAAQYENTMSQEKVMNLFLDQIYDRFSDLAIADTIDTYQKNSYDFFLLAQNKWHDLYQSYGITDVESLVRIQNSIQDDTEPYHEKVAKSTNTNHIKIRQANSFDHLHIKKFVGSECGQYYNAWRVENTNTRKEYSDFINHHGNICKRMLWHGSGNANWWSILNSGLVIHPNNTVITGRMFGDGIYFATAPEKSIYFTSLKRSNERRRFSNTSFMGLYEVAYGIPYHVYSYDDAFSSFNYRELQKAKKGTNCLHAHKGEMLKNEEIVIYKEEQATIKYLVEFRQ